MKATRALLCLAALVVGCTDATGNDPETPDAPKLSPVTASAIAASNGQTGLVGSALPFPLRVRVLQGTAPKADVEVSWQSSSGSLIITASRTDANGEAVAGWVLGNAPGPITASAAVDGAVGSPVVFHATALDYVTAIIDPVSENQSAVVGTELPHELRLVASSSGGRAANVTVLWSTSSGTVSPASSLTDVNGVATAHWTLGTGFGPQTATATVARTTSGPLTIHANATLLPDTVISKGVGTDSQSTPLNFPPARLWVTVQDAYGNVDTTTEVTWSVVSGSVTLQVWGNRGVLVASMGTPGGATVRAALPGGARSVEFTVTILPRAPRVTLVVGSETATEYLSGLNGTNPAVDTIAVGGTMTWFLSDEDLDLHAVESVGLPAFVGGYLGYGGTSNGLSVTFSVAGTYLYQDPYYPGKIGTLVVQ